MTNTYTVYTTYVLVPTGNTAGYSEAIHCNYINSMQIVTDNLSIQEIRMNFTDPTDFKFLNGTGSNATGYSVHRIYAIFQVILNTGTTTPKPVAANWKYLDVTNQVVGYTGTGFLTPAQITSVVFKIPLSVYGSYPIYILDYINYPSASQGTQLCFGDETYFFGNVTSQIKADVYTTDLSINLVLGEFNSTSNPTWDGLSKVYISEIGIYDTNKNLVGIAKLNDPVPKDNSISRTILFALDF